MGLVRIGSSNDERRFFDDMVEYWQPITAVLTAKNRSPKACTVAPGAAVVATTSRPPPSEAMSVNDVQKAYCRNGPIVPGAMDPVTNLPDQRQHPGYVITVIVATAAAKSCISCGIVPGADVKFGTPGTYTPLPKSVPIVNGQSIRLTGVIVPGAKAPCYD